MFSDERENDANAGGMDHCSCSLDIDVQASGASNGFDQATQDDGGLSFGRQLMWLVRVAIHEEIQRWVLHTKLNVQIPAIAQVIDGVRTLPMTCAAHSKALTGCF